MSITKQSAYLKAMGITQWVLRADDVDDVIDIAEPVHEAVVQGIPVSQRSIAGLDWPELAQTVSQCQDCGLSGLRTQTVFGAGNQSADCLVIGEAPGEQEDLQGEPFVGRAGLLLNNMLLAFGFSREQVYIANVVKCRPPGNRDPEPEETAACSGYLQRQVELVRPRVILVVGRVAAQTLLESDAPVGRLRGQVHQHAQTNLPLVVTYHPAYLLRRPSEKVKAWLDLKLAYQILYTDKQD